MEDGRLLAQAVKEGHAQFQFRAVPGYYGLIDYLCGHEPYGDRAQYPVPDGILIEYALGSLTGTDVLRWVRGNQEFAKFRW